MPANGFHDALVEFCAHLRRAEFAIHTEYVSSGVECGTIQTSRSIERIETDELAQTTRQSGRGMGRSKSRKAVELAIALTILGATLVTSQRLDRSALKRAARVFL